ncbi:MAG: hypothetical protein ACYC9Z_18640 [Casimicrobiaceae bacterium]
MATVVKLSWLQDRRTSMQLNVTRATEQVNKLTNAVQAVLDTPGLDPDYKRLKIEGLRKPVVDAVIALVNDTDAQNASAVEQKALWQSKSWVLQRAVFDADPVADATIRQAKQLAFAAMNPATVQSIADAAIIDGDLPTLAVVMSVSLAFSGRPGWRGVSLDNVVLPEQDAALQVIRDCGNLVTLMYQQYTLAQGKQMTSIAKATAGRAAQALRVA